MPKAAKACRLRHFSGDLFPTNGPLILTVVCQQIALLIAPARHTYLLPGLSATHLLATRHTYLPSWLECNTFACTAGHSQKKHSRSIQSSSSSSGVQASSGGGGGSGAINSGGGGGGGGGGSSGGGAGLWSGYLRLLETQPVGFCSALLQYSQR